MLLPALAGVTLGVAKAPVAKQIVNKTFCTEILILVPSLSWVRPNSSGSAAEIAYPRTARAHHTAVARATLIARG